MAETDYGIALTEADAEYTLIDVIEAYKNAGCWSINVQTARNFLILNDEYFDSDHYADFIDAINEIRDLYITDLAYALFHKTPDDLLETERYDVFDALSKEDKCAIFGDTLVILNDYGVGITFDVDANGYPVFYGDMSRVNKIVYHTEHGDAPASVRYTFGMTMTQEALPTLTAEGYVHTGWVDFFGDPVKVGDTFECYPVLTAVWEEAPATVDYTITYQSAYGTAPTSKMVTVNYGERYILTADDLPTLTEAGYAFNGWTANGTAVSVGDTISADTTLVAVWEIVPVELPEWTSGDGWVLYGGVKLPVNPTDYPYMIIGYDKADEQYELIASAGTYAYGTKTFPGEGVYTGFIANSSGGASVYSFDGTQWVFRYKTSGAVGGMLTAFTIEETGWANFDIDILNEDGSTERTFEARTSYALDRYSVLEWDGNTDGLTEGSGKYLNYYRVSNAVLPDLGSFDDRGVLGELKGLRCAITEIATSVGGHYYTPASCFGGTNGLWFFQELFYPEHPVYYAENSIDGLPEPGLYLYNDGTDRTVLFAYGIVTKQIDFYMPDKYWGTEWVKQTFYSADGDWKKKRVTEAYQEQDGEWVKIAPSE